MGTPDVPRVRPPRTTTAAPEPTIDPLAAAFAARRRREARDRASLVTNPVGGDSNSGGLGIPNL